MICDECGTNKDVYETSRPYDSYVLGIETSVHLCDDCEDEEWALLKKFKLGIETPANFCAACEACEDCEEDHS